MSYIRKNNPIIQKVRKCGGELDTYVATKMKISRWFNLLNQHIFKNELQPFKKITVRRQVEFWAECDGDYDKKGNPYSNLLITTKFPNLTEFVDTLVHEMVHHYQWTIQEEMSHGKSFHIWRPKINRYELPFRERGLKSHKKMLKNKSFVMAKKKRRK